MRPINRQTVRNMWRGTFLVHVNWNRCSSRHNNRKSKKIGAHCGLDRFTEFLLIRPIELLPPPSSLRSSIHFAFTLLVTPRTSFYLFINTLKILIDIQWGNKLVGCKLFTCVLIITEIIATKRSRSEGKWLMRMFISITLHIILQACT